LGFVHVGHENSFVYDIADLYKADITIPLAFEVAATIPKEEIPSVMRRKTRDKMVKMNILKQMVHDIKSLLAQEGEAEDSDAVYLWDNRVGEVENGRSYGEDLEEGE